MSNKDKKPAKEAKPKKEIKTLSQQLDAAVSEGFAHILLLNDKSPTKKTFRAAFGHGYHEAGPVDIRSNQLNELAIALVDRSCALIFEKCMDEKTTENLKDRIKSTEAKLKKAKKQESKEKESLVLKELRIQEIRIERIKENHKPSMHEELVSVASHCAHGMHSYDGKLVHPESRIRLFQIAKPNDSVIPYLFSQTASNERQISAGFAHKPEAGEMAILFHAVFQFEGAISSFAQLLHAQNPVAVQALVGAGVSLDIAMKIQDVFQSLGDMPEFADSSIPQQSWPDEGWTDEAGSYSSIQALPSVAVYASLTREKRRKREDEYLPGNQLQVGSGQAQNISIFASSTSGFLSMLMCEPPMIYQSSQDRLIKMCWRKSLIAAFKTKSTSLDKDMEKEIWMRPNDQRERFLKAFATKHVSSALFVLNEARDIFDENNPEWVEASQRLSGDEMSYLTGKPISEEDLTSLFEKVLQRVPLDSLKYHHKEDHALYLKLVKSAIQQESRGLK